MTSLQDGFTSKVGDEITSVREGIRRLEEVANEPTIVSVSRASLLSLSLFLALFHHDDIAMAELSAENCLSDVRCPWRKFLSVR